MLLYMSTSFHRTPLLGLNGYNNRQYVHGGALDSQTTETQFINHVIGRGSTTGHPRPTSDAKGTPLLQQGRIHERLIDPDAGSSAVSLSRSVGEVSLVKGVPANGAIGEATGVYIQTMSLY